MYLAPWMQQTPAVCSYFQQFLHCKTSRFMFAPHTIRIKLLMLKCLLMIFFTLELFCVFHMSIQMMAISDLSETLIILGLEVRIILLNIWLALRMLSTSLDKIHIFEHSLIYGIPTILRYNLDCGSLREEIWSMSDMREFFTHFSISWRLEGLATLLVMIMISLSSTQMKSAIMFDLISLRTWFMLIMYMLESFRYCFVTLLFIGIITCFHKRPFVVMFR